MSNNVKPLGNLILKPMMEGMRKANTPIVRLNWEHPDNPCVISVKVGKTLFGYFNTLEVTNTGTPYDFFFMERDGEFYGSVRWANGDMDALSALQKMDVLSILMEALERFPEIAAAVEEGAIGQ